MSLQEKFQIITPVANEDDGNKWVSFESARESNVAGTPHCNNEKAADVCADKFNYLPPGMDIDTQKRVQIEQMPLSVAGATDVTDDTTPEAFKEGFRRRPMKGTDDVYSGEHIDHFYGEAIGDDGNEGFVERNNYLDRI